MIRIFKRRSGIEGKWEREIIDNGAIRVIELQVVTPPANPPGDGVEATEARVFFGTLGHRKAFVAGLTYEQILETARKELRMDPAWEIQATFPETKKTPKTIVATLNASKPVRQAPPAGIDEFIAMHVEKWHKITEKRIRCKGNESLADQIHLIADALNTLMDIFDWSQKDEGPIFIQCSRAEFNEVTFILGDKSIHAWRQAKATDRHREKLASVLFDQKVVISQQLFGDDHVYTVVPYSSRFRKPKDTRTMTRQLLLPGAPAVVRPPVETRKYWGDPVKEQRKLVDGVEDGSRFLLPYDPTQRIAEVDPDVEALVRGHGRDIPGETWPRTITWVGPAGDSKLVKKLLIPEKAGSQDLLFRFALATKRQELDARYVKITPEDWREGEAIRIEFKLERPLLRELN
jgi:hypothetical protein